MKINDNKVVIVIPVHSPSPSQEELIAFAQCYKVLSNYPIYVLHPKGLELEAYKETVLGMKGIAIDPIWLSSIENYNKLKYSSFLYKLFDKYTFLLTYELDAYVFRDELIRWCDKDYSYIGAPWFKGYIYPVKPFEIVGIGNSGFSLRNISSCLTIIKRIRALKILSKSYSKIRLGKIYAFSSFLKRTNLTKLFKIQDSTTYLPHIIDGDFTLEDHFWSVWVATTFDDFKLAPVSDALQFSFEVNPKVLYKMNNNILPFGCHAWLKYDPEFWKAYIDFYSIRESQF